VQQVAETYGLPVETFEQNMQYMVITKGPHRLDLNLATAEELAAHPYLSQRQAEAIVNYRTHHGNFSRTEDLLNIFCIGNDLLNRIEPYLLCNQSLDPVTDLVAR
jgi:competence ComEA-like helix-hairpin-helix protein